jgi:hypothetical protein
LCLHLFDLDFDDFFLCPCIAQDGKTINYADQRERAEGERYQIWKRPIAERVRRKIEFIYHCFISNVFLTVIL